MYEVNPAPAKAPILPEVNGMINKSVAGAAAAVKDAQITAKEIVQDIFNWTNQVGLLTKQLIDFAIDSSQQNENSMVNFNPAISVDGIMG
ncbi:uncharacterized protein LOC123261153 isoform X2 [Cotesia glomerata]|uniref:uncharacterized protein LOC123261153 isoform X2 n=1 Tax=Cotesia glomerata TaxID=32391 RepID=UPI001D0072A6|nr:uncharacterized protein LOC123261153 isoform X2 [Cotesia glomerata]